MVKKKSKAGAPKKQAREKKNPNGLTGEQAEWVQKEAKGRGVYKAIIIREAIDFYRTALETERGDTTAHKLFDDKLG